MENGKVLENHCPPTPDTGIPDLHDFMFIKEGDATKGDLYLGGRGQCHTRLFGT